MKTLLFVVGLLSVQSSFAIVPHVWQPVAEKAASGAMWLVKHALKKVFFKEIKTTAQRVLPEQGARCVLKALSAYALFKRVKSMSRLYA